MVLIQGIIYLNVSTRMEYKGQKYIIEEDE